MADTRLRALERRAATGTLEDAAALLRERLRVRQVDREHVKLAAYLGHPVARRMLRWEPFDDEGISMRAFATKLSVYGRHVVLRAAVAMFETFAKRVEHCPTCTSYDSDCSLCGGSGYVITAGRPARSVQIARAFIDDQTNETNKAAWESNTIRRMLNPRQTPAKLVDIMSRRCSRGNVDVSVVKDAVREELLKWLAIPD